MEITHEASEASTRNAVQQQFVTFRVGQQSFAVPIDSVREIRGWQHTTPIPNSQPHILGVINLRGQIIAIYDLRQMLGMPGAETFTSQVVLVVDVGERLCGLVADAVSDIISFAPDDLRDPPTAQGEHDLVTGLAVKGETVIGLLDIAMIRHHGSPAQASLPH